MCRHGGKEFGVSCSYAGPELCSSHQRSPGFLVGMQNRREHAGDKDLRGPYRDHMGRDGLLSSFFRPARLLRFLACCSLCSWYSGRVITSYSIHYTKLYDEMHPLKGPAVFVKMASPAVFCHHDGEIPLVLEPPDRMLFCGYHHVTVHAAQSYNFV